MTHYEGARARAPWSPWRYRRGLGEVARVVGLMLLYYVTRGWAVGREDAALDHARAIIALEQRLGIYREPGFNAWVTLHPLARDALNLGYTYLHLPVLAAFGFWLYWRRPGEYPAIRNTVFISAAAALLVYTLFPVAPPHLLPDQDFTDTLAAYSHVSYEMHSIQGFRKRHSHNFNLFVIVEVLLARLELPRRKPTACDSRQRKKKPIFARAFCSN